MTTDGASRMSSKGAFGDSSQRVAIHEGGGYAGLDARTSYRRFLAEIPALDLIGAGICPAVGDSPTSSASHSPEQVVTERDVDANEATPEVPPSTPFVRRHRRRATRISRSDIHRFWEEILDNPESEGSVDHPSFVRPTRTTNFAETLELQELNEAFSRSVMSLNNGGGMPNNSSGAGLYTSFMENSSNSGLPNLPRQSPSPSPQHSLSQVNGGSSMAPMNVGMPMNAGHQMDLNHLYEMVVELSEVLKNNRDMTRNIINSAEEIMRRSSVEGGSPNLQQVNGEISAARVAELERALAREKSHVEILKREQAENTKLIGEYETAVGAMVEQIRNYCQNNNMHFLAQKRHYNNLLQAERDAHLESRLDRDYWHAQTMRCAEMIRTAHRLRCEEEEIPIRVISGLQNEVRAYRHALGMEPEKSEEEFGWEFLKELPPSVD